MVFLRIAGMEWLRRGNKSARTESASEEVIMWGSATIGREMVVGSVAVKS